MSKKVLVISTSLRKNSNSEKLAEAFASGAEDAGNVVEFLSLKDKTIAFCEGCMACHKLGRCVIDDDANMIARKMYEAEVIAFATPIYYYEMSGQMKTMIDRANSLYDSDYKFTDIYMLTTAAEDEPEVPNRAIGGLTGWIDCFDGVILKDVIKGVGCNEIGDINNKKELLNKAYEIGNKI